MAKKKTEFGRPAQLPDNIPSHLKGAKTVPRTLVNGSVDDYSWFGDDGNWNPQQAIDEMTSPAALLRLVVQAIVGANPSSVKPSEDRIEDAMRALLGRKGKKGRRNLASDASILQCMAGEYLRGFYGFKAPFPSLNALADWALRSEPGYENRNEEWKENRRRTIARKFQRHRNRLLTEFASAHDLEMQETLSRIRVVLESLGDLGISVQVPNSDRTKLPELSP